MPCYPPHVLRPLRAALVALLAGLLLAGCDGGPGPSSSSTPPFEGNSTCSTDGAQPPYSPDPPNTNGTPAVGQSIPEMPHTHVDPPTTIQYNHDPPTSGCHYNLGTGIAPIAHGAYTQVIPPMYWMHNLEHGYVAVLYNCPTGCDTEFSQLRTWLKGLPPDADLHPGSTDANGCGGSYARVIIVPETTMKDKFAVVSWDWYLGMGDKLDMSQVQAFYANHINQAPEKGSC